VSDWRLAPSEQYFSYAMARAR